MEQIKITTVPSMRLALRNKSSNGRESESESALAVERGREGSLHLTPHHWIFREKSTTKGSENEIWIPLPLLHSVTRPAPNLQSTSHPLTLRTLSYKTYDLSFPDSTSVELVYDSIRNLCTSSSNGGLESLYAFYNPGHGLGQVEGGKGKGKGKAGWGIYDPRREFERMGVGERSKAWRFSGINEDYQFCPSYPAEIVVPAKISDTTLTYAVKYRSKGRIPGLVYLHWANLGSITRSSQPMVGLKNARSIQDEKLIEAIFASHSQHSTLSPPRGYTTSPSSSTSSLSQNQTPSQTQTQEQSIIYGAQATNLIIDARPTTNAMANSVKGAGTENMEHYRNCKKSYLGIDNIHVMRSSLAGVYEALRESDSPGSSTLDRTALRRTNWLKHLTNILDGILVITRTIHLSNSHVLVHCSDGWDRTSQLSSLAQLCLDPFYRTSEGFAVLIEKDWISYGHKFSDRTGYLCDDRTTFIPIPPEGLSSQAAFLASVQKQFSTTSSAFKETCPVFQQFLDCVYQIMRQFPARFEFGESLLRKLQEELYAGGTGSFLFNSEKQRVGLRGSDKTPSVWEGIFDEPSEGEITLKEEFKNPSYDRKLDDPDSREVEADQGVLMVDPKEVKWWYELFGRSDEEMNGKVFEGTTSTGAGGEEVVIPISEEGTDDPALPSSSLTTQIRNLTLSPPSTTSSNPSSPSISSQATISRSSSPATASPSQNQGQTDNISTAVSSVQKFGWGAFKSLQKGYQEVVVQYKEAAAAAVVASSSTSAGGDGMGSKSLAYVPRERLAPSKVAVAATSTATSDTNGNHREAHTLQQEGSVPSSPISSTPISSATPFSPSTAPSSSSKATPTPEPSWSLEDNLSETYSARKVDAKSPVAISEVASEGVKEEAGSDPLGVGFL